MFYVYQYLREDGTPYYIGKGTGYRAWQKGKHEQIKKPTDPSRIVIVKDQLTEQEAHQLEIELIAKFGRKDINTGILRNLTNGGDGVSGAKFGRAPEERIARIAAANTGKKRSPESREKMSNAKIGTKQTEETVKKRAEKLKGITRSDELKKQWSDSKLGEKNPMFGVPSSKKGKSWEELYGKEKATEMKEALRQKRARQIISEETKEKMSKSHLLRHAKSLK